MRIGKKILLFYLLLILLLCLLAGSAYLALQNSRALTGLEIKRHEAYQQAEQLRRSSDELTHMARAYVATGDSKYRDYYDLIAAIREGRAPRPGNYHYSFWDQVLADAPPPASTGEAMPLLEQVRRLELGADEIRLLEEAKIRSDILMDRERQAFETRRTAGQEQALQILYGSAYFQEKAALMARIDDFHQRLTARIREQVQQEQLRQEQLFMLLFVLSCLLIVISLLGYVYFKRAIVAPLTDIQKWIQQIDDGDYDISAAEKQDDEIGRLANAFIRMARKVSRTIAKLEQVSRTDPLTGTRNRIALDDELQKQKYNYERYGIPFSVIMLDMDHFKEVNDQYGHLAGDAVLKELTTLLCGNIRNSDVLGRWGGEEFLIVCPLTRFDDATILAESLRVQISEHEFSAIGYRTASFGVSEFGENNSIELMIDKADRALYRAKAHGRNQVC